MQDKPKSSKEFSQMGDSSSLLGKKIEVIISGISGSSEYSTSSSLLQSQGLNIFIFFIILVLLISGIYYFKDDIFNIQDLFDLFDSFDFLNPFNLFEGGDEDEEGGPDLKELAEYYETLLQGDGHDISNIRSTQMMKYNTDSADLKCCGGVECDTTHKCDNDEENPTCQPIEATAQQIEDAEIRESIDELDELTDKFIRPELKIIMMGVISEKVDDLAVSFGFKILKGVGKGLISMSGSVFSRIGQKLSLSLLNRGISLTSSAAIRRGSRLTRPRAVSPFAIIGMLTDIYDPNTYGDYLDQMQIRDIRDELDKTILNDLKQLGLNPPFIFQLDYLEDTHNYENKSNWDEFDYIFEAYRYSYNQFLAETFMDQIYNYGDLNEPGAICELLYGNGNDENSGFFNQLNQYPLERDNKIFNWMKTNLDEIIIEETITESESLFELGFFNLLEILKNELLIDLAIELYKGSGNSDTTELNIYNIYKEFKNSINEQEEINILQLQNYLINYGVDISQRESDFDLNSEWIIRKLADLGYDLADPDFEISDDYDDKIPIVESIIDYRTYLLLNTCLSYIQHIEKLSTTKTTGITLSQQGIEKYREKIYEIIQSHENNEQQFTETFPNSYNYNYNNPVKISLPIYSEYYRVFVPEEVKCGCILSDNMNPDDGCTDEDIIACNEAVGSQETCVAAAGGGKCYYFDNTEVNDSNVEDVIYNFSNYGVLGGIYEEVTDIPIPGIIEMRKITGIDGNVNKWEDGEITENNFDGFLPQLSLSEILLSKVCRKGYPGLLEIEGGEPTWCSTCPRETSPHINNIEFDDVYNSGLCKYNDEDFCIRRLGNEKEDFEIQIKNGSYCSGDNCEINYTPEECREAGCNYVNASDTTGISLHNCDSLWADACGMLLHIGDTGCRGMARAIHHVGERYDVGNSIVSILQGERTEGTDTFVEDATTAQMLLGDIMPGLFGFSSDP